MSEKTKQPKKVVLLDLDGTLTKSDPGIIGCVVKVFEELGYPVPDDEELQRFIGPAIVESLQRNNISDDLLDEALPSTAGIMRRKRCSMIRIIRVKRFRAV